MPLKKALADKKEKKFRVSASGGRSGTRPYMPNEKHNGNADTGENHGSFTFATSDESFRFSSHKIADPKISGAQVANAARAHPLSDYVILSHLPNGELETLRPTEMADLREQGIGQFFVIRGSELFRFTVDELSMEWPRPTIPVEHVKLLALVDPTAELILETPNGDRVMRNGESLSLSADGVERLKTRRASKTVTVIYNHDQRFEMKVRDYTTEELMQRFNVPSGYKLDLVTKEGELRELKPGEKTRMSEGLEFVSHPPRGQSS